MEVGIHQKHQNFYEWKEKILNDENGSMNEIKEKFKIMTEYKEQLQSDAAQDKIIQIKAQTKAFPIVDIQAYGERTKEAISQ